MAYRKIRKTSIMAYRKVASQLPTRQRQVFLTIAAKGPICNMDIAKILNLPINQVTPRTNELYKKGDVHASNIKKHPITKVNVLMWSAT